MQYADGLNATVRDLELFDGQLHAGGDAENIAPVFGLARIAVGATTWQQLMPNLTLYFFPGLDPPAELPVRDRHSALPRRLLLACQRIELR
ncbi:MAG: hypothetical protein IPH53_22795 [Flavobacteriales bacterium]|nr:hypothetical protein [Flavobacteriales bacterium]